MRRGTGPATFFWVLLPALVGAQVPAPGTISVEVGVVPTTVTVGEPFTAALRVVGPAGVRVEYAELTGREDLTAVAPFQLSGDGTAAYRLVAWRADVPTEATLAVRLMDSDGSARIQLVRLRLPEVRSVLPAGDTAVAPRPAKGYLPIPGRYVGLQWWYWLIALAGALLATMLALHLLRRQDRVEASEHGAREWALRQIDRLIASESPLSVEVYLEGTRILRGYLARLEPDLGTELTTTELLAAAPSHGIMAASIGLLRRTLDEADRIKFSGNVTQAAPAEWLMQVREWISTFPVAETVEPGRRAA